MLVSASHYPRYDPIPREIQSHIGSYVDTEDLTLVARVSTALLYTIQIRFFEHNNVFLPANYGKHVLIQKYRNHSDEYDSWAKERSNEVQDRRTAAMRGRYDEMIAMADMRKWSQCRSVQLKTRAGAADEMKTLLTMVSDTIERLSINSAGHHIVEPDRMSENLPLDHHIFNFTQTLPCLTYLQIGAASTCTTYIVLRLVSLAHDLESLDVVLSPSHLPQESEVDCSTTGYHSSALSKTTRIRRMRLAQVWALDTPLECSTYSNGAREVADTLIQMTRLYSSLASAGRILAT
jgi:hypothetical protein